VTDAAMSVVRYPQIVAPDPNDWAETTAVAAKAKSAASSLRGFGRILTGGLYQNQPFAE